MAWVHLTGCLKARRLSRVRAILPHLVDCAADDGGVARADGAAPPRSLGVWQLRQLPRQVEPARGGTSPHPTGPPQPRDQVGRALTLVAARGVETDQPPAELRLEAIDSPAHLDQFRREGR